MYIIQIRTIGEVSFRDPSDRVIGYRYDIPFDSLHIPFLPMYKILSEAGLDMRGIKVGFARPDGYEGLVNSAQKLLLDMPGCAPFIRSYFTRDHYVQEEGCHIRSLKAGRILKAGISFADERRAEIEQVLAGITHLGIKTGSVSGQVQMSLSEVQKTTHPAPDLPGQCSFHSLEYSAMLISPACFRLPYGERSKTCDYIPGEYVRDAVSRILQMGKSASTQEGTSASMQEEAAGTPQPLICTNAYISDGERRLLPVPACVSVVKLDRGQLRYRLAPGKDPRIVEQDIELEGAYTYDVTGHLVRHTTPETQHIMTAEGEMYDALSTGQVFRGKIYGTDEQIRAIAGYWFENPLGYIGDLTEEGFGSVYCTVERVDEPHVQSPMLAKTFDVYCASHMALYNEKGVPVCSAEDLLGELEYKLGLEGKLILRGKYTNVQIDASRSIAWGMEREAARLLAAGSVLRVEAAGDPVDISSIRHCFIGERTEDGYGEVIAYPAQGQYYRLAQEIPPAWYTVRYPESSRALKYGSGLTDAVIRGMLRSRIEALAAADRQEYAAGHSAEELIPTDILQMFRERYDPMVEDALMRKWYQDALEGGHYEG